MLISRKPDFAVCGLILTGHHECQLYVNIPALYEKGQAPHNVSSSSCLLAKHVRRDPPSTALCVHLFGGSAICIA